MSGKHDKSGDEEQAAKLLLTGPIVIRGLGRGMKDALIPSRPSRHRAFRAGGTPDVEETVAPPAIAAEGAPDSQALTDEPGGSESVPFFESTDAPSTQETTQEPTPEDPSFPPGDVVLQTEGDDRAEAGRVQDSHADDRAEDRHAADAPAEHEAVQMVDDGFKPADEQPGEGAGAAADADAGSETAGDAPSTPDETVTDVVEPVDDVPQDEAEESPDADADADADAASNDAGSDVVDDFVVEPAATEASTDDASDEVEGGTGASVEALSDSAAPDEDRVEGPSDEASTPDATTSDGADSGQVDYRTDPDLIEATAAAAGYDEGEAHALVEAAEIHDEPEAAPEDQEQQDTDEAAAPQVDLGEPEPEQIDDGVQHAFVEAPTSLEPEVDDSTEAVDSVPVVEDVESRRVESDETEESDEFDEVHMYGPEDAESDAEEPAASDEPADLPTEDAVAGDPASDESDLRGGGPTEGEVAAAEERIELLAASEGDSEWIAEPADEPNDELVDETFSEGASAPVEDTSELDDAVESIPEGDHAEVEDATDMSGESDSAEQQPESESLPLEVDRAEEVLAPTGDTESSALPLDQESEEPAEDATAVEQTTPVLDDWEPAEPLVLESISAEPGDVDLIDDESTDVDADAIDAAPVVLDPDDAESVADVIEDGPTDDESAAEDPTDGSSAEPETEPVDVEHAVLEPVSAESVEDESIDVESDEAAPIDDGHADDGPTAAAASTGAEPTAAEPTEGEPTAAEPTEAARSEAEPAEAELAEAAPADVEPADVDEEPSDLVGPDASTEIDTEDDSDTNPGEAESPSTPHMEPTIAAASVVAPAAGMRTATPRPPQTSGGSGRPPRRPRPMRERVGREAVGIAVLVVLALICGGLITAVVLKTHRDAAVAAQEAANYTPPPLATPEPTSSGPVVAVIGDGTANTAASGITSAQKWSGLLGSALSGTISTDASSGMGYAAKASGKTFVTAAADVPSNADVVVFFGGAADSKISSLSLARAATDAFSAATTQAPDAKVVVVGPVISGGVDAADLTAIRNSLRSAASIAKATWVDPIGDDWLSTKAQSDSSASALTLADQKTIALKMEAVVKKAVG